ncbi:hypothetical protein BGZ63DRAFT_35931 [Mariannaea sp. PMI_226]|nr:hypothetical protein BGZ63DRAFT_35931 [Mariannaea sp. PMI_226]
MSESMTRQQPSSRTGLAAGPFIISTSLQKPDAETRKFIRSHVMRGKNTRKSRRAKEPAQQQNVSRTCSSEQQHENLCWTLVQPRKIASEISLFDYVDDMKPYMLDLIYKAFVLVKPSTHTLEIVLVDGKRNDMFCFSDFPRHPALLHSILFTSQAFYDHALGLPYGKTAQLHLAKTLFHLQKIISSDEEATSDSTLAVVLSLATAAAILGDIETVKRHMSGLCRIIEMRGGLESFEQGSMVEHKSERLDFGLAIATGSNLQITRKDISWGPQVARGTNANKLYELGMIEPRPDPRLLNIWADLQVLTRAANEATRTGVKIPQGFFSLVSSTVPPRLLALKSDPSSLAELLRLCMLAYMKSVLIQIDGLGPQMKYLRGSLKYALLSQQFPPVPAFAEFLLWALFVSALSIFENLDEAWLRTALIQTVSLLELGSWTEIRTALKKFLWVDMLYDGPGKRLFDLWLVPDNELRGVGE